jgi:SprT protein
MAKEERPLEILSDYLPAGSETYVIAFIKQYKVHLTITRERKSILGDYRSATHSKNHRISVNGNLNQYAFLITFLHELAHLLTFEQYAHRVPPHGQEWKTIYGQVLADFLQHKIFPEDIEQEIMRSLRNPAASSCAEENLMRILRRYDPVKEGVKLVEDIAEGALFKIHAERIFRKGEKIRKRYKCLEVKTGKLYLFSGVFAVEEVG